MSGSVARAASRNRWTNAMLFWVGINGHFLACLEEEVDDFCWSSAQRSLMAEREPKEATAGLMQSFWREERGRTLTGSDGDADEDERRDGGMDGGKEGRRSSVMNCVS